ncbi:Fungal lipase-like domain-containing protein [Plasmodiophora brassicae]
MAGRRLAQLDPDEMCAGLRRPVRVLRALRSAGSAHALVLQSGADDLCVAFRGARHAPDDLRLYRPGDAARFYEAFPAAHPARVYAGALDCFRSIYAQVDQVVVEWLAAHADAHVRLTGHGSGALLAILQGCVLQRRLALGDRLSVVTFGAPRVGNAAFQARYRALVPRTYRVLYGYDPVCFVNVGEWKHVGRVFHLRKNGRVYDATFARFDHRLANMDDHDMGALLARLRKCRATALYAGRHRRARRSRSSSRSSSSSSSGDPAPSPHVADPIARDRLLTIAQVVSLPMSSPSATSASISMALRATDGLGARAVLVEHDPRWTAFAVDRHATLVVALHSADDNDDDAAVDWLDGSVRVHAGYLRDLLDRVQGGADRMLTDWTRHHRPGDVVVAGHGVDGAVAALLALHWQARFALGDALSLVTFGAEPVVARGHAFAWRARHLLRNAYRVVNARDPIILSDGGRAPFRPVGDVVHLRADHRVAYDHVADDVLAASMRPSDHEMHRYVAACRVWTGAFVQRAAAAMAATRASSSSPMRRVRVPTRSDPGPAPLFCDPPDRDLLLDLCHFASLAYRSRAQLLGLRAWPTGRPCTVRFVEFLESSKDSQAALFAYGNDLVVSFRGSMSEQDFKQDLSFKPTAFEEVFDVGDGARVHGGFMMQWRSIRAQLDLHVGAWLRRDGDARGQLFLTGHSLGGALAVITALYLEARFALGTRLLCATFGAPRVGNTWFKVAFRSMVANCYRVVNNADMVTAQVGGYALRHVGAVLHFRNDGYAYDSFWQRRGVNYSLTDHMLDNYKAKLAAWDDGELFPGEYRRGSPSARRLLPSLTPTWLFSCAR